jgi:hypothetical protein
MKFFIFFITWSLGWSAMGAEDELLSRIRARMVANLAELPNYVCRQTIDRTVRRGGPAQPFLPFDSTRMEVAFLDGRELFARSGKDEFTEKDIRNMISPGVVGNGSFAMHVEILFNSDAASFSRAQDSEERGRHLVRYDFEVPLERSSYVVRNAQREARVAYHGSFWADAETLDLVRLAVEVTGIPHQLGMTEIHTKVEYRRTPIGNQEFLLPYRSELIAQDADGTGGRNYTKFDHCRKFEGNSIVRYGDVVPAE